MVRTVFEEIDASAETVEYTVKISMVEIYRERIRDLLDPTKTNLKVAQDKQKRGLFIEDLTESYVSDEQELYAIMKLGNDNRSIGATNMNEQSSRSHSIVIMSVASTNTVDFS